MAEKAKSVAAIESIWLDDNGQRRRVVNQKAYEEYQKLIEHPLLTRFRMHECSDGQVIDMLMLPHRLRAAIKHLPADEQHLLLKRKDSVMSLLARKNTLKRSALGLNKAPKKFDTFEGRKTEVIELFGRMFSIPEVYKIVTEEWNLQVDIDDLREFRLQHRELIQDKIEEHKRSHGGLRLGYKRSRLEELQDLYKAHKHRYLTTKSHNDHRACLSTLEQIRKEVEGDTLIVDGNIKYQMELSVTQHMQRELLKNVHLKEIVLARLAVAMNVSILELLATLRQSYYSQFNAYVIKEPPRNMSIPYPSQLTYDFEAVVQKIEKQRNPVDPDSVRQRLLSVLGGKEADLTAVKNELVGYQLQARKVQ